MPRQKQPTAAAKQRLPLTRERILFAAMEVADEGGAAALTIRSVAQRLDAKPMAIYHHVRNKEEILDGLLDLMFAEIDVPDLDQPWRAEIRRTAGSARRVLHTHPWAIVLLQGSTSPGPATLRHHDAVIGVLRGSGLSVRDTAHAFALLDSYVYGFALSEAALPINGPQTVAETATAMIERNPLDGYPHLLEFTTEHVLRPDYDFGEEFDFGLDVLMDGMDRLLRSNMRTSRS